MSCNEQENTGIPAFAFSLYHPETLDEGNRGGTKKQDLKGPVKQILHVLSKTKFEPRKGHRSNTMHVSGS